MSILVGFASGSGCTQSVAEWITDELNAAGRPATCVDLKSDPDPSPYDGYVVGSGVRGGSWHAKATTWLKAHAAELRGRPLATYSVCLNVMGDPRNPSKPVKWDEVTGYAEKPAQAAGLDVVESRAFAGWWQPREFSFAERMIMKALKAPVGDFRDETAVRAWARELAASL